MLYTIHTNKYSHESSSASLIHIQTDDLKFAKREADQLRQTRRFAYVTIGRGNVIYRGGDEFAVGERVLVTVPDDEGCNWADGLRFIGTVERVSNYADEGLVVDVVGPTATYQCAGDWCQLTDAPVR